MISFLLTHGNDYKSVRNMSVQIFILHPVLLPVRKEFEFHSFKKLTNNVNLKKVISTIAGKSKLDDHKL